MSEAIAAPRWMRLDEPAHAAHVERRLRADATALPEQVIEDASAILADVERRGDAAVIDYTERFDGVRLTADQLRVDPATIHAAAERAPDELRGAIAHAAARIRAFHEAQRRAPVVWEPGDGSRLRLAFVPVASAALYVPGGRAAYPSSVLMNAIPALVAGVERIAVFTVPRTVEENPAVACALTHLGLEAEVYRVGGAQAIAAAAYGTASIAPVDVITGPGNAWVAAAKRQVYGRVGIDSVAGPSEVLILADSSAPPEWVALDLLAQAEHDPLARCVVACTCAATLDRILDAFDEAAAASPRRAIVEAAWRDHGLALHVDSLDELRAVSRTMGPEHLQLFLDPMPDPASFSGAAIFVGAHTPTALGDYVVGSNHVLPTGGTARFSGPLGTDTFLRSVSIVESTERATREIAPTGALLADHERLPGHAAALRARITAGETP
jgi:histidinol dehydrogenase